jgi:hypothetical protein
VCTSRWGQDGGKWGQDTTVYTFGTPRCRISVKKKITMMKPSLDRSIKLLHTRSEICRKCKYIQMVIYSVMTSSHQTNINEQFSLTNNNLVASYTEYKIVRSCHFNENATNLICYLTGVTNSQMLTILLDLLSCNYKKIKDF